MWFKSVTRVEFERLYQLEVLDRLDPKKTLAKLQHLAGDAEPVLLCWELLPFTSTNWCHRRMVAEWFEKHCGIAVPELEVPARG